MRCTSRLVASVLVCAPLVACFAGYDSRWGEQKRAQQRAAATAGPAAIEAPSAKLASAAGHVFRARIWVSPTYVSQTVDWRGHVRAVIDDVNQVLPGAIDVRLDVDALALWDAAPKDDGAEASAEALRASDPGEGVDVVVGMIGGVPRFTRDFHELGLGETFGKVMVVRGTTTVDDQELIDNRFDQLGETERTRLRHEYRQHRELAVFLHEYAHTLGAIHESTTSTLMAPAYNRKMSAFAAETLGVLRIAVAHRAALTGGASGAALTGGAGGASERRAFAQDLLAYYDKTTTAPWVSVERDQMVAMLRANVPPASASSPANASAPPAAGGSEYAVADPALSADDRALWARAVQARAKGDPTAAWTLASPLFVTYPKLKSVQEFRCKLAIEQRFEVDRARKECAPITSIELGR
jgi:hypothetical protein